VTRDPPNMAVRFD